jgi:hypothetical protein
MMMFSLTVIVPLHAPPFKKLSGIARNIERPMFRQATSGTGTASSQISWNLQLHWN